MPTLPSTANKSRWQGRLALTGILGLAAVFRLWHLDQNGYGRQYYAAGVRSMMESLHCFFFNSFDPGAFVSLDKPPVALWFQVASAKVLGFSAFGVMLPQVLEGLVSVILIYKLVARRFGETSALLAALCLALTPISVAVDRSNNTDSCLIMVLLLAAWALIRATEAASARLLVLAMVLIGIGFNVKMAAALVVVPTFMLVYLIGTTSLSVRQRLSHIALSVVVLVVVSLSWVTIFDLTPPTERPYAGSTKNNSMLELALMHNGLNRFIHRSSDHVSSDSTPERNEGDSTLAATPTSESETSQQSTPKPKKALWDKEPTGAFRLLTPFHVAQMGWWLPFAIAGLALVGLQTQRKSRFTATQLDLVVWGGWALTYAVIFSFAGGVFHTYYLSVLAPPLAALSGIGCAALWRRFRDGSWRNSLPAALVVAAGWQLYIEQGYVQWSFDDWHTALLALSITGLSLAAIGLFVLPRRRIGGHLPVALAGMGLTAALLMPTAWALSTVLVRPNVAAPSANIAALNDFGHVRSGSAESRERGRSRVRRLVGFLKTNRTNERFLVAVPNAFQAAPLIMVTGQPVMAMGGYLGRDPILTPNALERLVANGDIRFVMLGGFSLGPANTLSERNLADWIVAHGKPVYPAWWRDVADSAAASANGGRKTSTPSVLYDLRPGPDGTQYRRIVRANQD